jgi:carnitine-CoA ligase
VRGELVDGARLGRRGVVVDLIEAVERHPDSLLLRWPDGEWSYAETLDAARRCAQHLERAGIVEGDRVAIVSGNSPWRLAWQLGTWWLGAVEVSVNSELRGEMLEFILRDCDPSLVLLEREFLEVVGAATEVLLVVIEDVVPATMPASLHEEWNDRANGLASSGLGTILYTSGTTGASKGVMLPRGYFSNLGAIVSHVLRLESTDVGYFVLPFFHVDAHIVLPATIQSGAALAFDRRFSVSRWWEQIRTFGVSWAFVIGAVLSIVMKVDHGGRGSTRVTRFLGAPIPADAYPFFEDDLGIAILSMYGQTEADGPTFDTFERRRRGGAGYPCAGFDVEIQDSAGRSLGTDEVGEIVFRPHYADMAMLGYWRRDDATVETWRNLWLHSGDLGRIDEDGFLHFVCRMTDSLRRRGENISAMELETAIRKSPAVEECAVVAVDDELGDEDEIKVFVVPSDPESFDVDSFFAFCEGSLPRYAVPRYVELTEEPAFVRSVGTGVIQKRRLSRAVTGPGVTDRLNRALSAERKVSS